MSERIRITDVSPRDGLQNEARVIPTSEKLRLVEALGAAGVDEIEVSSFVSARWVPQLADAAELLQGLRGRKPAGVVYSVLVPNDRGMQAALAVNAHAGERLIDKIAVFTAASETFSRRNTNAGIAETLDRFAPVLRCARENGLATRGYVSCMVRCPFEGPVAPATVADVAVRLRDLGVDELDLGETIGVGTPDEVTAVLSAVCARLDEQARGRLTLHLHDTHGRAVDSVRAALAFGIRSFDGSAGGLGGCPYASTAGRRAPGNIATETLVAAALDAGFACGADLEGLRGAAAVAQGLIAG